MPIPLLSLEYKGLYARGLETGYSFYHRNGLKLSVITLPRLMGYHSGDSSVLSGMEDRRWSFDAGLRASLDLMFVKGLSVNAKIVNDVLSRYDGREGEISLEQAYRSKHAMLRLTGGVKVQSAQLVNYYYGVRSEESSLTRSAYDPGHAVDPFLGVLVTTGISEKWLVLARLGAEFLDNSICNSPIVDKDHILTGMLGVARKF
jgi:outer membrane protein